MDKTGFTPSLVSISEGLYNPYVTACCRRLTLRTVLVYSLRDYVESFANVVTMASVWLKARCQAVGRPSLRHSPASNVEFWLAMRIVLNTHFHRESYQ